MSTTTTRDHCVFGVFTEEDLQGFSDRPFRVGIPSYEDVLSVAGELRDSDAEEIQAAGSPDPEEEVLDSWMLSQVALMVYYAGYPVLLFGVAQEPHCARAGIPWLVATDKVRDRAFRAYFRTLSPIVLAKLLGYFLKLRNWVADWNRVSKTWLRRLGFTVYPPAPFGPFGAPFCEFSIQVEE